MTADLYQETNKRIARQVPEEIATKRNYALADELFAEDAVEHTMFGRTVRGREAGLSQIRAVVETFPDFEVRVEDVVAEGDTVAMRVTISGTQTGPLLGFEPTGKSFEVGGTAFTRIEDGQITERWVQADTLGMLTQLGHVDGPADSPDGLPETRSKVITRHSVV